MLYELLSGQRAFPGTTAAQVAAAVLRDDPAPLPVAPAVQNVLRRCMAKDPTRRFQTTEDLRTAVLRVMGEQPRPLFGRIEYHLWCDEIDSSADWYARAIDARDPLCVVFAHAPIGRALRASARWPPLARAMNLPEL